MISDSKMSISSDDDEIFLQSTPPDIVANAENAINNLLPSKSREKYEAVYQTFMDWKTEKKNYIFFRKSALSIF